MIGRGSSNVEVSEGKSRTGATRPATVALLILVSLVAVASAFASDSDTDTTREGLPGSQDILAGVESGSTVLGPPESTDPAAAEGVPHRDLGRTEALELMQGVFGPALQAPAGILDELEVERFLSPTVAVLPAAEGAGAGSEGGEAEGAEGATAPGLVQADEIEPEVSGSTLLASTVPLQADPSAPAEPIDLSLEPSGGDLEPANPATDLSVPMELGDGIELPGPGVTIELADAPDDRSPTTVDDSVAFYPNVAEDTDLAVAPTATGVETLTQIRSAESPRTQTFELDIPAGAQLQASANGGATVSKEDELLLGVAPPIALDAAGQEVPVSLDVAGNSLVLHVSPDESTQYPVLLDPLFQTYEWRAKKTSAGIYNGEWKSEIFSQGHPPDIGLSDHVYNTWVPLQAGDPGLFVTANGEHKAGDYSYWVYPVPRYFTDNEKYGVRPTSYISHMTLSNFVWHAASFYLSPYVFAGIWDPTNKGWVSYYSHESLSGHSVTDMNWQYQFANSQPNTNAKVANIGIYATETQPSGAGDVYVGTATIELADSDVPQQPVVSGQSAWVNQTAPPITFTATDTGLGVSSLTASTEQLDATGKPLQSWKASYGCTGTGGTAACPRTWKSSEAGHPSLTFDPSTLPPGYNYLNVIVEDPVANKSSAAAAEIKVDHTKPELKLSGPLTETATLGGKLPSYQLNYAATDGDETAAQMTSTVGTSGTGTGQIERPQGVAVDASGNVWVTDKTNNRVVEYDKNGAFVRQIGTGTGNGQIKEPRGITVTAAGNVWVVETAPNKRLQEFNGKGEFIRKVTHERIIEPWGIAAGPNETIWVADQGSHKLLQFKEDGTYLRASTPAAGGGGTLTWPIGVAVDAKGNVWTADESTNKVSEFDANGNFLFSFGATGSGNGQFSAPQGVAIAASGNVLVVDAGNNRVEEFRPNGSYVRQGGTAGSGTGQLKEPRGIAVGSGNTALIADAGNRRVTRWSHAAQDLQSGVAKVEVKVDGKSKLTTGSGCATQDCKLEGVWTLKANEYTAGQHELEVIATDGVNLAKPETLKFNIEPDLTAPNLAVTGSMTEQAALGTSRPQYKLRLRASDGALGEATAAEGGPTAAYAFNESSGTAVADASTAHNGTVEWPIWTTGKFANALKFDGEGTCVKVPNSVDLQLSGSFTLEAWVNPDHAQAFSPVFFKDAESFYSYSLYLGGWESGHLEGFLAEKPWEEEGAEVEAPEVMPSKTWTHVAMTSDGATLRLYVNGKQVASDSAAKAMESKGPLYIGCGKTTDKSFNLFFEGLIDNVRIYNRALSATELETDKATAIGPPAAPPSNNPVAAYGLDEGTGATTKDAAGTHNGTIDWPNWTEGKFGKALNFLGEGECVTVPNSPDLRLTGPLTLEAWINPANVTQWAPVIFKEAKEDEFYGYSMFFGAFEAGHVQGYIADAPYEGAEVESPGKLVANTWSHIAMTSDGTTLRLYVNGTQVASAPSAKAMGTDGPLLIGCSKLWGEYFEGKIDNVRIYPRALSAAEIEADKGSAVAPIPGPMQSGIAKTEITLDGKVVDSSTGCSGENCTVAREWTLPSAGKTGQHTVVTKVTDGFGNTTSKTTEIEIQPDTAKPTITTGGALSNAPSGWVEQEGYGFYASAKDAGYGVTSLALKIDGAQVASASASCADGGCEAAVQKTIDMASYSGGAHPAEVIAADGAGNTSTQKWTINVDPDGHISAQEMADTVEALEETSSATIIGEAEGDALPFGVRGDVGVTKTPNGFEASGSEVPLFVGQDPSEGFIASIPEEGVFNECVDPFDFPTQGEPESEPQEKSEAEILKAEKEADEAEGPITGPCTDPIEDPSPVLEEEDLGFQPVDSPSGLTVQGVSESTAAAATNTSASVDTITRPIYEGALVYQAIRSASASQEYEWEVSLSPGQTLEAVDSQHAEVYYANGHPAFGIQAEPAHDAVGAGVPTTISVTSPNVIVLTVAHRDKPFVYPVIGGAGWRGGFVSVAIQGPKDEQELKEEREREEREERERREAEERGEVPEGFVTRSGNTWHVHVALVGPPVGPAGDRPALFPFRFSDCRYQAVPESIAPPGTPIPPKRTVAEISVALMGNCVKIQGAKDELNTAMMVLGWFGYNRDGWVWVSQSKQAEQQCISWGPHPYKEVNCYARPWKTKGALTVGGNFRGYVVTGNAECVTVYGHLSTDPPHKVVQESIISIVGADSVFERCDWP